MIKHVVNDLITKSVTEYRADSPIGVIVFAYDIGDHHSRYEDIFDKLTSCGLSVYSFTFDGFCEDIANGASSIFDTTSSELSSLVVRLKDKYKLPVYIIGMGYGGYLVQNILAVDSNNGSVIDSSNSFDSSNSADSSAIDSISKAVIIGSGHPTKSYLWAAKGIVRFNLASKKRVSPANSVYFVTYRSYDRQFKQGLNCYLSRDKAAVGKYNIDTYGMPPHTYGFFRSLIKGLKQIRKSPPRPSNIPVLILSGTEDLLTNKGKASEALFDVYSGQRPSELKLYPEARHNLLLESNSGEVAGDIIDFVLR